MSDLSNYGTLLKEDRNSSGSYIEIAGITKIEPPKRKNPSIDATNHGSGGVKRIISSGLVENDPVKFTLSSGSDVMVLLDGWCNSGCVIPFQVYFPNTKTLSFNGIITEFGVSGADAGKPELLAAEAVIEIDGAATLA